MKIGMITDIHNNIMALEAVLRTFESEGCEGIICAGDIVGIGPHPEETVTAVRKLKNLLGCVKGNHEEYLLTGEHGAASGAEALGTAEREYCHWENSILSETSKAFLEGLSYEQYLELKGRKIYIAHYSMNQERRYNHIIKNPAEEDLERMFPEADIVIYGHDHGQNVVKGKRWYINCGALGCPGADKNLARAGILTLGGELRYDPVSVLYDADKAVEAIDRLNYPDKDNIKKFFYGR